MTIDEVITWLAKFPFDAKFQLCNDGTEPQIWITDRDGEILGHMSGDLVSVVDTQIGG